ncbi:MAG TPA: hypothetical protein VD908_12130 [Cytophagales bacterium]|nr:hypothetical protein [Cytophagales bacterium]
MNRVILLLIVFTLSISKQYSQNLTFDVDTAIFKESSKDSYYYLTLKMVGNSMPDPVQITIQHSDLSATRLMDYDFIVGSHVGLQNLTSASGYLMTIGFIVKPDAFKENDEQFVLNFVYDSAGTTITKSKLFIIKDVSQDTPVSVPDTSLWKVRLVTGSNFDFFGTPTFKNFAGVLDIFLPDIFQSSKWKSRDGLNLGLFNYSYFSADSSGRVPRSENYFTDPSTRMSVVDSTKYVREIYSVNSRVTYNNWGFYLNLLHTLDKSKWHTVFLSLNSELIWRNQTTTYNEQLIRQDTFVYNRTDSTQGKVLQGFKGISPKYNYQKFYDIYLGIGVPIKVNIKNLFDLYLEPSAGFTFFDALKLESTDDNGVKKYKKERVFIPYLLTKWRLTTNVTPVDITLGGEIRPVPAEDTFIAIYLAVAISLDKLIKP